jgi:hypothetical protein
MRDGWTVNVNVDMRIDGVYGWNGGNTKASLFFVFGVLRRGLMGWIKVGTILQVAIPAKIALFIL